MPVRLQAVAFDAPDPRAAGVFWADLLGRPAFEEHGAVLVRGDDTQVGLRFVRSATEAAGPGRLHLHVTTVSRDDQRRTVDRVLASGGRRRGTKPLPIGDDVFLTDPSGNDFCVIEPGNAYLAGCGVLGEVTCEGTRAVGRFWLEALGWDLVWDEGDQIAIQSPRGGTKIAWDGPVDASVPGWNRQRFDLVASDPAVEVERLLSLGATRLGDRGGVVLLSDPDGGACSIAPD